MIESNDELLVFVLHELREPLTTIGLWEQLLREHGGDPELQRRALDAIRRSTQTQTRLVRDLLDLTRALRGTLQLVCKVVQIQPLLQLALHQSISAAAEANVAVAHTLRQRLGRIEADPTRVAQILVFMITAAIEQTPANGCVTVRAVRQRDVVRVSVADMGPGMTAAAIDQFHDVTKIADVVANSGRRGLELLLCRALAELLGGSLTLTSLGPGQGTTWTLMLPLVRTTLARPI